MNILQFITNRTCLIIGFVWTVLTCSLINRNKQLKEDNTNKLKTIELQKKIMDVKKNTKSELLDGNLERMRNNKL